MDKETSKKPNKKEKNAKVEVSIEKVFIGIQKMKCNYAVYKKERTKFKVPFTDKCKKCGRHFRDNDEIYTACLENENKKENCVICKSCANQ